MRIKGGVVTRKRKKRLFKKSKGFRLSNKNVYIHASERVDKALVHSYRGRIQRKRDKRSQWILTLNAAARLNGLSYSRFISGIKKAGITLNRKMLADIAVSSPEDFIQLTEIAKTMWMTADKDADDRRLSSAISAQNISGNQRL